MDVSLGKQIDHAIARYRLGVSLELPQARWLRGAWRSGPPGEFHQHDGDRLIYHHPLVRYDVSTGEAIIAGLAEGAVLLRSLPAFDEFSLGGETHQVLVYRAEMRRVEIGPTCEPVRTSSARRTWP